MRRFLVLMVTMAVMMALAVPAIAAGNGATQVAGHTDTVVCADGPGDWSEADYSFHITGDLEGCVYGLITYDHCTPSGMYQERADEIFVSDADPDDTFQMTEFFWAKYVFGAPCDFETVEAQVFGGCKHPIKAGKGTGAYEGVTGRLDFKDDVDTGIAHYKGHLRG